MSHEVYITNLSRPLAHPIRARYCDSFFCRLRGLTFRRNLPARTGLLLVGSRENRLDASIHMLFMWLDLAIVWIDSSLRVVDVKLARRWKLAYLPQAPARYVLELPVDCQPDFAVGDLLKFENQNVA
jgi:uncharacterized membrane protein (UPF0127 family)